MNSHESWSRRLDQVKEAAVQRAPAGARYDKSITDVDVFSIFEID